MRFLKHRAMLYLGLVMFLALATLGTTNNAFASLSEHAPASVSATPVSLNGANHTTTYALALTVANTPPGNGAGWNLTITSTLFTNGASKQLASSASSINAAPTLACNSGCQVNPTNGINYPVNVPAGNTPPTAVKFFNAAAGTGTNNPSGSFLITPTVTITIPANAYAGTYTSTLTIAIASGP